VSPSELLSHKTPMNFTAKRGVTEAECEELPTRDRLKCYRNPLLGQGTQVSGMASTGTRRSGWAGA
jgi:hypothetical protein